ncbi:glycosyltransferase family 92 protein [Planktothrix agardhii]|uniref:glycosyltransferase family 92 protein n=1 Tax=Planktothrix agardhii TaxID=1160 RepID=UPI0020A816DE|nr:glycosyltransferase family 92 protein [Planktothrix agardhii]CAD5980495.1 Glycosyltransferase family 92 protein Os08g0121900 [Planktothrix agardhii]
MTESPLTSTEMNFEAREVGSILNPIVQHQYEVEIETIPNGEVLSTSPQLLAGFAIELPIAKTHTGIQKLIFKGWVIAHQSKAIAVEIIHLDEVINTTLVNQWRPDVNVNVAGLPAVEYCGYGTSVKIQDLLNKSELKINTILEDGTKINLGKIQIKIVDLGLTLFRDKCDLSICSILKNEAPYLIEWLEFHKLVGVERFYLYNNNSTDHLLDIIQPYLENGEVILHDWPFTERPQMSAYEHCLAAHSEESEWIAFIDLDEFLAPTEKDDLKLVLQEFKEVAGVVVNQLFFGTSGHQIRPQGLQIENYTKLASDDYDYNTYVKSIVRPDRIVVMESPHHCLTLNPDLLVITENQEPTLGAKTKFVSVNQLRLHHYHTRSQQEMLQKAQKGDAFFSWNKSLISLQEYDKKINAIEDLTLHRFVTQLRQAVDKVISQSRVVQILQEKWQLETQLYQREIERLEEQSNFQKIQRDLVFKENQLEQIYSKLSPIQSLLNSQWKNSKQKCKLSICAILKNEAPYLIEWLEFHKIVGVERFYLYDNFSSDHAVDLVQSYIDSGEVIWHEWPIKHGQLQAYQHCLENYCQETEWLALIDLDEFLFPTDKNNIQDLLDEYKEFPAIGVNWLVFGSSGHRTKPDGLQIENFTHRSEETWEANKHIKSIVQPTQAIRPLDPHSFTYINNQFAVTENKEAVIGPWTSSVSVNKLIINHYTTRSLQEYTEKMNRGIADVDRPRIWGFEGMDRNEVQDLTIQRFVPQLKQAVNSVISQLPIAQILQEKQCLTSELYQVKSELETVQQKVKSLDKDYPELQSSLELSHKTLQQHQEILSKTELRLEETEKELATTKLKLADTQEKLERSQSQFDEVLSELEEAHLQLHQKQKSLFEQPVCIED